MMLYDQSVMDYFPVMTPADVHRMEEKAFSMGVSSLLLMEHAAIAVVDALEKELGGKCVGKTALFLCGTGNNGGDGLAAARLFRMRGGQPTVWLYGEPKTQEAKVNLHYLQADRDIEILNLSDLLEGKRPCEYGQWSTQTFDAYVDALLGTGFRGEPDDLLTQMMHEPYCHFHRKPRSPVIAIDIPSGIDGTTGNIPGHSIFADVTVTLNVPKPGLYLTKNRERVGKIVITDIGLWPMVFWNDPPLDLNISDFHCAMLIPSALKQLKDRSLSAHKGDCGRVLIYAGSMGMAGAAAMCAKAAVTAGAGLTTIACEKEIMPILQTLVPNAMCTDIREAVQHPPAYDVLAVGPGLGQSEAIWENILKLWNPDKKSVWDADALNLLAKHPMKLGQNAVVTPHPGEAARLLGCKAEEILSDRLSAARRLAEKYACTAVLKSDVTVICAVDEEENPEYMLNTVGSPALAKGGSGDALTGVLAALLNEKGGHPLRAAALACLWHGMAGVVGEETYGQRELTADQLIFCLHDAERWGRGEIPAPACAKL